MIKSRRLGWAGHSGRMGESRGTFKILRENHTEKRPLGRPGHRWEDNIRVNLKAIGANTWIWIDSAQDRYFWRALVNVTLNP